MFNLSFYFFLFWIRKTSYKRVIGFNFLKSPFWISFGDDTGFGCNISM